MLTFLLLLTLYIVQLYAILPNPHRHGQAPGQFFVIDPSGSSDSQLELPAWDDEKIQLLY